MPEKRFRIRRSELQEMYSEYQNWPDLMKKHLALLEQIKDNRRLMHAIVQFYVSLRFGQEMD